MESLSKRQSEAVMTHNYNMANWTNLMHLREQCIFKSFLCQLCLVREAAYNEVNLHIK